MNEKHSAFSYILSFTIALFVWKLASLGMNSPVLPPPEDALLAFIEACGTRSFWQHFFISTYRVVVSIALSWVLAFPCGLAMGYNKRADDVFSPIVFMTYPIPKMVLLPVILLLFGLGNLSKIILISLILFFQILVATRDGVKSIDEKYFDSMRSMGASATDIMREVVFPAALPHSFTALRISTGTAISVLFFVESFATTSGLGYMIMDSWVRASYTQIFVGIIAMSLLGLILYETFRYLEMRLCSWKYSAKEKDVSDSKGTGNNIMSYLRMIKFSHTIFALPFAFSSVVLVNRVSPITVNAVFWIIMAMIGARSAAMGFNRIADARIDAKNPRTAVREIPSGNLSQKEAISFIVISAILFVFSAAMLSELCFWLSFPVLLILFAYSYTKRFTWLAHIFLGFSIGLVPMAVWVAIAGDIPFRIVVLSLALLTYIAGFDILYSCQDVDFDRGENLHSIPVRFGVKKAMVISSFLHVASFLLMFWMWSLFELHFIYPVLVGVIGILFFIEHKLVNPDDLSKIDIAFFNVNSVVSIMVFVSVLLGELLR